MGAEASNPRPFDEEIMTAPEGGLTSGEIVQAPSGRAGYVVGLRGADEGQPATIKTSGRITVPALSTLTGSPSGGTPVEVDWDDDNSRICAAGDGDFLLGILAADKTNGQTTAEVILNEEAPSVAST